MLDSYDSFTLLCLIPILLYVCPLIVGEMHILYEIIAYELTLLF